MTKKQTKRVISLEKLGFIVLIAIGFNSYFTMAFDKSVTDKHPFFLISTVVFFNVVYFLVTIPFFVFKEIRFDNSLSSMEHLLSTLEYLTPSNIEQDDINQIETEDSPIDMIKDPASPIETIEEETIQISNPNQVIAAIKTYNKVINLEQYASLLHRYLLDYGLKVDLSNIRTMFGAMGATRLIMIKSSHQAISRRFITLFSDFVGANFQTLLIRKNYQNFKEFISDNDVVSTFLLDAHKDKNKINMLSLSQPDLNGLERFADVFINYAMNTTLNKTIGEPIISSINELSNNLWFMVVSDDQMPRGDNKIVETAFCVELNASIITPKEIVHENGLKLSFSAFLEHLRESYEDYYLDESYWKKIDQLEDYTKTYRPFRIDNRITLQLERFSTLYLLSGGDSKDCVDTILSAKLLIMIGAFNMTKKETDETSFLSLLEKLFGLENLSLSKAQIKEIEHSFTLEKEEV